MRASRTHQHPTLRADRGRAGIERSGRQDRPSMCASRTHQRRHFSLAVRRRLADRLAVTARDLSETDRDTVVRWLSRAGAVVGLEANQPG